MSRLSPQRLKALTSAIAAVLAIVVLGCPLWMTPVSLHRGHCVPASQQAPASCPLMIGAVTQPDLRPEINQNVALWSAVAENHTSFASRVTPAPIELVALMNDRGEDHGLFLQTHSLKI